MQNIYLYLRTIFASYSIYLHHYILPHCDIFTYIYVVFFTSLHIFPYFNYLFIYLFFIPFFMSCIFFKFLSFIYILVSYHYMYFSPNFKLLFISHYLLIYFPILKPLLITFSHISSYLFTYYAVPSFKLLHIFQYNFYPLIGYLYIFSRYLPLFLPAFFIFLHNIFFTLYAF